MSRLMNIAVVLAAFWGIVAPSASWAQGANTLADNQAEAMPDAPIAYTKHILPNGLTLLVHSDHKAPLVSVQVWYNVGSRDEVEGKTGFAHLFEHLMFNGSAHHNDEFFRPLLAAGASQINGTTNSDRTNFYQTVPTEALDLALWLESDRMAHLLPAVTQAKLDEQRGVVKNEKRQRESQPYGGVDALVTKAMYPVGHPYSWTTIGSMEDLDRASLADVQAWFKRYYGPNNAVLVLAGDIRSDDALAKVQKFFAAIPPSPPINQFGAWIAPLDGTRTTVMQDRVAQTRIYRLWNVPPRGNPDALYLALAADVLASDKASRLYKRLVTQSELATQVSASLDEGQLSSQFGITVTLKAGANAAAVEAILDEEIAGLSKQAPSAPDLARIITNAYVARLSARESVGSKASELAHCQVFRNSPEACERDWQLLRSAKPQDVTQSAERWLNNKHFTLRVEPTAAMLATGTDVNRSALPTVGEPAGIQLPPLTRFTLSNGMNVLLAERHEVPLVHARLLWPWGTAAQSQAGQMEMLLGMLSEGAADLNAEQLTEAYADLGAQFGVDSDMDSLTISLSSTRVNFDKSLALFAQNVRMPSFPSAALARRVQRKLASLRASTTSAGGILGFNQYRLMYGDHPYGRFNSLPLLEASSAAMTTEALQLLHRQYLRPDGATILVVGDIQSERLKAQLEARFADWKAPSDPPPSVVLPATPIPERRVFLFDKPDAEQSVIAAAGFAPAVNAPEREAQELANAVLGGTFVSRLNMNLREDKHWSYGASSALGMARGPGLFYVQASVQTDKTAESIRETQKELTAFVGAKPPTATEIDSARKSMIRTLPGAAETTDGVMGLYQNLYTYGLPDDHYNGYAQRLQSLDSATLAAAARQLVRPDAMTWFVVGDLKKMEAKIRALNLGPVTVMDVSGQALR